MFTRTGRSGRAKGVALASGRPMPSGARGVRMTSNLSAVRELTSSEPRRRAARVQSSTTPSSTNQMPSASATVSRSIVASDDKAPANPVMETWRSSPSDSWLSNRRDRRLPWSWAWAKTGKKMKHRVRRRRIKTSVPCRCRCTGLLRRRRRARG